MIRTVGTILAYELRSLGRDKKALVFFFGVPILLYPLGFSLLRWASHEANVSSESSPLRMAWNLYPEALEDLFQSDSRLSMVLTEGPEEAVRLKAADVGLLSSEQNPLHWILVFDASDPRSLRAHETANEILERYKRLLLHEHLLEQSFPFHSAAWFQYHSHDVVHLDRVGRRKLADWMSTAMVVMVLAFGSFACLDLFPAQRERGIMETCLVHPVPSFQWVLSKWLVCLLFCYLGTGLNLASLLLCAGMGLLPMASEPLWLPADRILWIFILLAPFCALVSSVLVYVTSLAKSARAAQGFILPACLGMLVPLYLAWLPGSNLDSFFCVIPVTNLSLVLRAFLADQNPWLPLLLVFFSHGILALVFLFVASRSWTVERLFQIPAEEDQPRESKPYAEGAFFLAAGAILLLYYLGSWVQSRNITIGLLFSFFCLLLVPGIIYAKRRNLRFREDLGLVRPGNLEFLLSGVISFPLAILVHRVLCIQELLLPMPGELEESFKELIGIHDQDWLWKVLLLAFLPALCEEFFFRGVLLRELKSARGTGRALLWSSLLFGLAHLSVFRFLPTTCLGFFLGLLVLSSRSLAPAILCHACFNALLIFFPEWPLTAGKTVSGNLLACVAVALVVGYVWRKDRP